VTDETKVQESQVEEGAQPQEESAPEEAAEPRVEQVEKEPPDTDKALREARRDARKAARKAKRLETELQQARQYRQRVPVQPPAGGDEQEVLRQEAMAYRQIRQEQFVDEALSKLKLEREDERLDYFSPETFLASAAAAKVEDFEDWEAELADKETKLESLGEKLRAEAKAEMEEMKRDLRREMGLDKVPKLTPTSEGGTTEAEIRAKYRPQLDALKGKGSTGEAMVLIREMEAEIAEAQSE